MFAKLSQIERFTVKSVSSPTWKLWQDGRMLESDVPVKGYREEYKVETEHGTLGLSSNQLAQLLLACQIGGRSDINGMTFDVKNNGQTGIEIRYFFNLVKGVPSKIKEAFPDAKIDNDINIPF